MTETKVCTKCSEEKDIEEFWITDKVRGYRRGPCKACDKAYQRQQYDRNPEFRRKAKENSVRWQKAHPKSAAVSRKHMLKHKYGLTEAAFDTMLADQDHRCALCGTAEVGNAQWERKHFYVDHDHSTGRVRGLLCHKCNARLGSYEGLRDEIGMDKVQAYLTRGTSPDD